MSTFTSQSLRLPTPAEARNAALAVPASPFFPITPFGLQAQQQGVFLSGDAVGAPAPACGIERVYPRFANGRERCPGTGAAPACLSTTTDFFNGKNYYNPSGAPFIGLGTNTGACQANRGCLDPTAANYNKLANTHCQDACIYRKPKVCLAPLPAPVAQIAAPCPAALALGVQTAEQAIYVRGAARALQQKQRGVIDWSAHQ